MKVISTRKNRRLLMLLAFVLFLGCERAIEDVSIDEVYWSAYRNPEGFNAYLETKNLDPRTSNCFRRYSEDAFRREEEKLRECSMLITGSPEWNECHDEAENYHNQGVIMNDIARVVDGPTQFAETQSYTFLTLAKSSFSESEWNNLVDTADANTPPFRCEYDGDKQWIWE